MAADGSVVIQIEGDDSKFKSMLSGLGGVAAGAVKGVTAAVTAVSGAMTAAGGYAVKVGAEFETSLAKVGTIADTSVKSLDELSAEVVSISNATGEGAAALNEALYSAISAGADTAHASELVEVAVKAAKGGFTDTETAVDGLTSALNAYGMQTTDANDLANKFLVTQNLGKTTFGELASSIGHVAPTANAAGVSVEDLLASVASLTANGIGTSEAMTGMKAAISNIIKPTSDAQKVAKQLGIDFSTAALQSKGWSGFLEDIKEKTGGNTDQMAALFGSVEALNTVLTLTSDQGMALMSETLSEMETNTSALDDAYNGMTSTFDGATAKLKENVNNLAISVYEGMKKPLTSVVQTATEMVQGLQSAFEEGGLTGLVSKIGEEIGTIAAKIVEQAPAMVDAATDMLSAFLTSFTSGVSNMGEAAGALITSLAGAISTLLPQIAESAITIVSTLADGMVQAIPELTAKLPDLISGFADFITLNLSPLIQKGAEVIGALADGIRQALPELAEAIPEVITAIANFLQENGPALIQSGIELLGAIAEGIATALPALIQGIADNLPEIIMTLIDVIASGLPKILEIGVQLIGALLTGIVKAIPKLLEAIPQIIAALIEGFGKLLSSVGDIGKNIVEGIWNGITGAAGWLKDKISGFADGVLSDIKGFFGIASPSKVMKKEVGVWLARGVGDGITSEGNYIGNAAAASIGGAIRHVKDNLGGMDIGVNQALSERLRAAIPQVQAVVADITARMAPATPYYAGAATNTVQTINRNTTQTVHVVPDEKGIFKLVETERWKRGDSLIKNKEIR